MKKIGIIIWSLFGVLLISSCELDNYDGPNASLSGVFIDSETGDSIQSDIIDGTTIELIEHGYENPSPYYLIVKVDGTYSNTMLFENTYSIPPIARGNFVPQTDTTVIDIKGDTELNFVVQPYIRILDPVITIDGTKVTATFRVQQTVGNAVAKIGLFGHRSPSVGEPLNFGKKSKTINDIVDPNETFELTMNVASDADFEAGKSYFFRVGAIIDADEAEYNYAPAVRLTIPEEE